jgi:hypothetical protein
LCRSDGDDGNEREQEPNCYENGARERNAISESNSVSIVAS